MNLYRSERYGMSAYRFTLPQGNYRVRLHWAEGYYWNTGARLFGVSIQGTAVLKEFE